MAKAACLSLSPRRHDSFIRLVVWLVWWNRRLASEFSQPTLDEPCTLLCLSFTDSLSHLSMVDTCSYYLSATRGFSGKIVVYEDGIAYPTMPSLFLTSSSHSCNACDDMTLVCSVAILFVASQQQGGAQLRQ